jgi:hypothetical protein
MLRLPPCLTRGFPAHQGLTITAERRKRTSQYLLITFSVASGCDVDHTGHCSSAGRYTPVMEDQRTLLEEGAQELRHAVGAELGEYTVVYEA